ncbi:hypothetical protein RD792_006583 [Penstemon davidsonii]|uniref:Pectinesterase inhibitor domain-containing protein n=1 Tax=Penstemon davidsonii TaxID=160366 RepID=A0ABR0DC24_9LAMI|nr:hypothetical protein RD792_006583 [Penstemon davidsonii]
MASHILLASIVLAFVYNIQADLISDVCSKSTNPTLCNQALRSDPRSRGADLISLGQIAVAKARDASLATLNVAKSLASGATKGKAESCIENCKDAIFNLNDCSTLLKRFNRGSISDLQTKGSAALTDIDTCDDDFGSTEPPKLKQASQTAQDLIDTTLVIFNRL